MLKNCRLSEKINETQKIDYEIVPYGISELKIRQKVPKCRNWFSWKNRQSRFQQHYVDQNLTFFLLLTTTCLQIASPLKISILIFVSSAKSGKCLLYGKLLCHTNKVSLRFILRDTSHEAFFTGTSRVILSIITCNFFVIRNKQWQSEPIECIFAETTIASTPCAFHDNSRWLQEICFRGFPRRVWDELSYQ